MQQHSVFDGYNHTELYQTCLAAGILIRPNEARDAMISYLEGLAPPPDISEVDHVFHGWRHGIIGFLTEHWRKIETQIVCPARALKDPVNPNPRPCFGCLDVQVALCVVQNYKNESLIDEHRLIRRPKTK